MSTATPHTVCPLKKNIDVADFDHRLRASELFTSATTVDKFSAQIERSVVGVLGQRRCTIKLAFHDADTDFLAS